MIWLSWRTLRSRWQVFVGTFLALTFGVALIAITLLCIAGTQVSTTQDDWLLSVAVTLLGNAAGVSGAAALSSVATLAGIHSKAAQERITAPLTIAPENEEKGLDSVAVTALKQADPTAANRASIAELRDARGKERQRS